MEKTILAQMEAVEKQVQELREEAAKWRNWYQELSEVVCDCVPINRLPESWGQAVEELEKECNPTS